MVQIRNKGRRRTVAHRMGRPPKLAAHSTTLSLVHLAGRYMATKRDLAHLFAVSEPTIYKFFNDHPDVVYEFERGQALTRIDLRRAQFALADAGDVRMLIWLGKVYLGQSNAPRELAVAPPEMSGAAARLRRQVEKELANCEQEAVLSAANHPGAARVNYEQGPSVSLLVGSTTRAHKAAA